MKERKNIDRLYQEKFRDFEASPREAIWKSISAKLQEEQKRKPVVKPLWTRIAGVAAIISLLVLIGDWILQPQQNAVVSGEEQILEKEYEITLPPETSVAASDKTNENKASKNHFEDPIKKSAPIAKRKDAPAKATSSLKVSAAKIDITSAIETENAVAGNSTSAEKRVENDIFEKKSILEVLGEDISEEYAEKSTFTRRIEIKTHAAPIYYGNLGEGNFLDSQFDNNSNEGEVTYSYGINVAFAISDKFKIRSGVNKVSMSYNTSGIAYHSVVSPFAVSSINYRNRDDFNNSTFESPAGGKGNEPVAAASKASFGNLNKGMLNQKLGYLEVPLEMEYKLIDKKIEVNLIGGASTLFLDENMISVNSGDLSTNLGEANNLNHVSFSTNIGLGVDYNLTKQFKLNVEPMFKYQLNTFNSSSEEYQPYYLGIYSGFSFEF